MKLIKTSFLFFCVFILFPPVNQLYAQQQKDSLYHYYYLVKDAKNSNDLFSAYKFYKRHKKLSLEMHDTLYAIHDLRYIADIEYKFGQLHESESSAIESLELLKSLPATNDIIANKIGIYNQLGIINKDLKYYDRAIEYYNKALEIVTSPKDKNTILNNRANGYRIMNDFEMALSEFNVVYQNSLLLKDSSSIAMALDNLGFVKSKLNHSDALQNMEDALSMRLKNNNVIYLYVSYIHLTEYYSDRNDTPKVIHYATKALDIATRMNNSEDRIKAMSYLIDAKGSSIMISYKRLTDSVTNANGLKENKFASIKYDYNEEKRKVERANLNLAKSQLVEEKQRKKTLVFGMIAVSGSIISALFYFLIQSKHKKKILDEVYSTETRISKKVHDEVANDVYQIMTKVQTFEGSNIKFLDDLEKIYEKTRDISKENSSINLDIPFNEVLEQLHRTYRNKTTNIITKGLNEIDWNLISTTKKKVLYRVLQELLTNMKKHSNASLVVLNFSFSNRKLHIMYKDNGIGCVLHKTGGLLNTENRIKSLNGTITFESKVNNGFSADLTI